MKTKIICLCIALILTGCTAITQRDDCRAPSVSLAYPAGFVPADVPTPQEQKWEPSLEYWEPKLSLVKYVKSTFQKDWQGGRLDAVHTNKQGVDTLWITFRTVQDNTTNPIDPFGLHILQVNLNTAQVVAHYETTSQGDPLPNSLFVTHNGELWGTGFYAEPNFPVLFRYDEENDQFESISDQDNSLFSGYGNIQKAVPDKLRDVIWISRREKDGKLHFYQFFLSTRKMIEDNVLPNFNSYIFITTPDGYIWVSVSEVNQKSYIAKYNPDNGETKIYKTPSEFSDIPPSLYYDRSERIWVGDEGWLDLSSYSEPVWYKIFPSPYFLMSNPNPEVRYMKLYPYSIYEDSNGLFWFTSTQGLIRLSPDDGKWCLITSDRNSVYEDSSNKLWIMAYGTLYKQR